MDDNRDFERTHNENIDNDLYYSHIFAETDQMRKTWFNYVLLSIEKLSRQLEDLRRTDLERVKQDLLYRINRLERRLENLENDQVVPLRERVNTIRDSVTTLRVKMGVWGAAGGIVGAAVINFLFWTLKN